MSRGLSGVSEGRRGMSELLKVGGINSRKIRTRNACNNLFAGLLPLTHLLLEELRVRSDVYLLEVGLVLRVQYLE